MEGVGMRHGGSKLEGGGRNEEVTWREQAGGEEGMRKRLGVSKLEGEE